MKKTTRAVSLLMAFVLMFTLVIPVAATDDGTRPFWTHVSFVDGDERYELEEFLGRIYADGNFIDYVLPTYMLATSRIVGELDTRIPLGPTPKIELFIVRLDGYQNIGPFIFDRVTTSEDGSIEALLRIDISEIRAMAVTQTPPVEPTPQPPGNSSGNGVYINGNRLVTPLPPVNRDGTLLVPLRAIGEALGAEFLWDRDTQTIIMHMGAYPTRTMITMEVGNTRVRETFNYEYLPDHTLAAPPMIVDGHTLVPLRLIAEVFGATVRWEAPNAIITTN